MRLACVSMLLAQVVFAQTFGKPAVLNGVGIDQKMGAQIPLDLAFHDEGGHDMTLRQLSGKPAILALVYYRCPSLCNMVLSGVVRSLKADKLNAGRDFNVIAVSFDPHETPDLAAAKKQSYIAEYNRPDAEKGWHFLTGSAESSKSLADSVGFHFAWDEPSHQFVHPSAIMILTPEGRVSSYFYGINYPVRDVRLALIEASAHKIGSPIDEVLLYCFHYDPSQGKYGVIIVNLLRIAGILTVCLMAGFIALSLRREHLGSVG